MDRWRVPCRGPVPPEIFVGEALNFHNFDGRVRGRLYSTAHSLSSVPCRPFKPWTCIAALVF